MFFLISRQITSSLHPPDGGLLCNVHKWMEVGLGYGRHVLPISTWPCIPDSDRSMLLLQLCISHIGSYVSTTDLTRPPLISPQVSLSTTMANDLIIQEVLLSGLALNYTFHGLSAGTEYTISVTAATDAGLGTQATITATTATMQRPEAVISAPGMVQNITYCLIPCQRYKCINTLQFIIPL